MEISQCGNIKSKTTRTNVQRALTVIISRLTQYKSMPDNGIIIYCGEVLYRNDKTTFEIYILNPPQSVPIFQYHCDDKFNITIAKSLTETHEIYGLIVLDLHEACWGTLSGSSIKVIDDMNSIVPSKHSQGGQSSVRFERLRDIAINEYFVKLGERISNSYLSLNLKGIIVGGCGMTKDDFIKGKFLHHELQQKIIGSFDTSYCNLQGLKELSVASQSKLNNINLLYEKEIFDEFLINLSKDNGKSIYGLALIKEKLEYGIVKHLIISSNYKGEKFNYTTIVISHNSEYGKMLNDGFGGIVGVLRYG